MYRVPTHKIRTGMVLARTITLDNNRDYLVAGTVLRESYIGLLLKHGITSVYVVNEMAPDVVPTDVVRPETRAEMTSELRAVARELTKSFRKAGDRALRRFCVNVDFSRLKRCVDKVCNELLSRPTVVYNLGEIRRTDDSILDHSVNVCILSVLLGTEMGYPSADLRDLAMGALLHDIGKITIPETILRKPGPLTPEEFEIMTRHTVDGWEILRHQREISPRVSIVALQHHERWQGGGYPYGLAGQEIYRFSRICSIVDCFDAMISDRVYRPGLSSVEALRQLTGRMAGYFEPSLLWNFTQCVAPYPVGSLVELSGGTQAVVVKVTRKQTYRPRVRLVRKPDGQPLPDPVEIDLADHPELQILRVITEHGETLAAGGPSCGDGLEDEQSNIAT